jgi:hypothetical protein
MSNGIVLRQPRKGSSTRSRTAEPSLVVLNRDSAGQSMSDRALYLQTFRDDPTFSGVEFLVLPATTGDLVTGTQTVTEVPFTTDQLNFLFNVEGYSITQGSLLEGDTPLDFDLDSGLIRYDTPPVIPPVISYQKVPVSCHVVKNDAIQRFDYDTAGGRWATLRGTSPQSLGVVPQESGEVLSLLEVRPDLGPTRLTLNTPNGVEIPWSYEMDPQTWQDFLDGTTQVPPGEARAFSEDGSLLLASDVVAAHAGSPLIIWRHGFLSREDNTGLLGGGDEDLYLNPVPATGETPLIRFQHNTYLKVSPSDQVTGQEDVYFDVLTGFLTFTQTPENLPVYYDGVLTQQNVGTFSGVDLGTITPSRLSTQNIALVDLDVYDTEGLILYVKETGESISELVYVEDPSDFPRPSKIPKTKAYVYQDSVNNTLEIQLSFSWAQVNAGRTLSVGTGDFYLGQGLTFRQFQSPSDLSNTKGIPDMTVFTRHQDLILQDSIPVGAFTNLPSIPLQNRSGHHTNTFYKIRKNGVSKVLTPQEDIVYDFDNATLKWASQENSVQLISDTTSALKLPHEILVSDTVSLELDTGNNFQPLVENVDYILEKDQGIVNFTQQRGLSYKEGFGVFDGQSLVVDTPVFNFLNDFGILPQDQPSRYRPLLLINGKSYRINAASTTTLTLAGAPINASRVSYEVYVSMASEGGVFFKTLDLEQNPLQAFQVRDLDTSGPSTNIAPASQVFFPSTPHVELDVLVLGEVGSSLNLPTYFQDATSRFELYLGDTKLTRTMALPVSGEYTLTGGVIDLSNEDLQNFSGALLTLVPLLSIGRNTGMVELLLTTFDVGIPADLIGTSIEVASELTALSTLKNTMFFQNSFLDGSRALLRGNFQGSTEQEGLFFVAEDLGPSFDFGQGRDVAQILSVSINGANVSNYTVTGQTLNLSQPYNPLHTYQITYYSRVALDGDVRLEYIVNHEPFLKTFPAGGFMDFSGDVTDRFEAGTLIEQPSLDVLNVSYDAGQQITRVYVSPPLSEDLQVSSLNVSNVPFPRTSPINVSVLEDVAAGGSGFFLQGVIPELRYSRFIGNKELNSLNPPGSKILYLDGEPHFMASITYKEKTDTTSIALVNPLTVSVDATTVFQLSLEGTYESQANLFSVGETLYEDEGVVLTYLNEKGVGKVLERDLDYDLNSEGFFAINPSLNLNAQSGITYYLSYLTREVQGPFYNPFARQFEIPRLKSSYSRFVAATEDNFAGGTLLGRFDTYDPDTFYFRVVPLADFVTEALTEVNSQGLQSFSSARDLYEEGSRTLKGDLEHAYDLDRAARSLLQSYHTAASGMERYIQSITGSVVGDTSGSFKFFLSDDDTPGGIDPVTGHLKPYVANPDGSGTRLSSTQLADLDVNAQEGFLRNDIDDLIVTTKKPFEFTFPTTFEFKGTYKQAWEPSSLSRFYPQKAKVVTRTVPDGDGDGTYEFLDDFGKVLGDLGQEDVLSLEGLQVKPPQGWVISELIGTSGSQATLPVGINFTEGDTQASNPGGGISLTEGHAEKNLPPFKIDDVVNLGRTRYTTDPLTGSITRSVEIYAQNMKVISISGDTIRVGLLDQSFLDTVFPTGGLSIGDLTSSMVLTDPGTLISGTPAAGYSAATSFPQKNDTLFGTSLNFLNRGLDFGLDSSSGELKNRQLPNFLSTLSGQEVPDPLTLLQGTVFFKNQRTEPKRFPALDGEPFSDDGLTGVPYVYPLNDSEIQRYDDQAQALTFVENYTQEDLLITPTSSDNHSFNVADDYTVLANPPRPYDLVLIENVLGGGAETQGSQPFYVSEVSPTSITLGAFKALDDPILYEVTSAFTGVGTGSLNSWTAPENFTVLSAFNNVTLIAGGISFNVTGLANGGLVVVGTPPSGSYSITVQSSQGSVPNLHSFQDVGKDFTWVSNQTLSVLSGTNVGTYQLSGFQGDVLDVQVLPVGLGVPPLSVERSPKVLDGVGSRDGTLLTQFNTPGVDWTGSSYAGTLFVEILDGDGQASAVQNYTVTSFGNGFLTTDVDLPAGSLTYAVTTSDTYGRGKGATTLGSNILHTVTDTSNQNIVIGDVLIIPPNDLNGGRYKITNIDRSGVYDALEVSPSFRISSGSFILGDPSLDTFPISFEVYSPRRFSSEVEELKESVLETWPVYAPNALANLDMQADLISGSYVSHNPSGPSYSILEKLVSDLFTEEVIFTDGVLMDLGGGVWELTLPSTSLLPLNLNTFNEGGDSYVLLTDFDVASYFQIESINSNTTLTLRETVELNPDFLNHLAPASMLSGKILRSTVLSKYTQETVLFEIITVSRILNRLTNLYISCVHNPLDLLGEVLTSSPGSPLDAVIDLHRTGSFSNIPVALDNRFNTLQGSDSIQELFSDILSGSENLYDLRYSWIDYRLNLISGSLPTIERLKKDLIKRERKRVITSLRNS